MAINIEVHEDTKFGPEEFVAKDSKFRCPLPKEALGYTGLPDYQFPGEWGSAGFNTAGVGMSSTETIFSSEKALAFDPYVENGLAENCTYNIVLPYIRSAREGAARLGKLIEQYVRQRDSASDSSTTRRYGIWRMPADINGWLAVCQRTSIS